MSYVAGGRAHLVCPELLKLDERHGVYWEKHPPCWRGRLCLQAHDHGPLLPDGGGHRSVLFVWVAGGDHVQAHFECKEGCHDNLVCACGRQLVYADLDNPWLAEVE
jgi:hypothetical protein